MGWICNTTGEWTGRLAGMGHDVQVKLSRSKSL